MITIQEKLYNKMPEDIRKHFRLFPNYSRKEVVDLFPDSKSTPCKNHIGSGKGKIGNNSFTESRGGKVVSRYVEEGSSSRFFYCAKASKSERNKGLEGFELKQKVFNGQKEIKDVEERFTTKPSQNNHPTVKPIKLMQYLCRLITPKGGTVLDPFNGSGSTGCACVLEGFNYIGIELNPDYIKISEARIKAYEEECRQGKLLT